MSLGKEGPKVQDTHWEPVGQLGSQGGVPFLPQTSAGHSELWILQPPEERGNSQLLEADQPGCNSSSATCFLIARS